MQHLINTNRMDQGENMSATSNRTALITGGGSGIGEAAAYAFHRAGYHVAIAGRRQQELDRVAAACLEGGGEVLTIAGDISDESDVERMVAATLAKFGRLDAAFNNAGIEGAFAPITDLTADDFDATMAVNLKGTWLLCKHEIAAMTRLGHGGAIVNTSSWLAQGAFPGSSIYSASKAALDGMIRALAQETAPAGVRINNVNPGVIDTPMFRRFADDEAAQPFMAHTPMRRLGSPDEVADVVLWLCSDSARFITGQHIAVDGGYTIPGHRSWVSGAVSPAAM